MGGSRGLQIGCAAGSWAVGDAGGAVGLQPDLLAGSRCAVSGWATTGRNTRPGVGALDVAAPSSGQVVGTAEGGRSSPKVSGTHLDLVNQAHMRLWNPLRVPASRLRATDSGRTAKRCARQGSGTALRSLAGGGGGSGGVGAARAASRAAGGRPRSHRRTATQRRPLRRPCQPPTPRPPLPHTQPAGQLQRPLLLGGRAGRRDRAHDLVRRAGWSRPLGHGLGGLRRVESSGAGLAAGRNRGRCAGAGLLQNRQQAAELRISCSDRELRISFIHFLTPSLPPPIYFAGGGQEIACPELGSYRGRTEALRPR